jgi:hypothetical protein
MIAEPLARAWDTEFCEDQNVRDAPGDLMGYIVN